ncbi:MAG: radical SAM protein [Minisyncoccia bacterium]
MEIRFVVATHCNADCYFCLNEYVGTKSPNFALYPTHYERIMRSAADLAVTDCTITGGEPTLRKDLGGVMSAIRGNASRITLITNGYRLPQHKLALEQIDELHVSFHSMNEGEWKRITNVGGGPERVIRGLRFARSVNEEMRIKLNVVSEEQNSTNEEIEKYLTLAKEISADINVFKEGYFSFLSEMGVEVKKSPVPVELWELESFSPILLGSTHRKKTFSVNGVKVSLSHTSTDFPSWDSCWITPMGQAFVDSRQRLPLIDLLPAIESENYKKIRGSLDSLFREAEIWRGCGDVGKGNLPKEIETLGKERSEIFDTSKSVNVARLVKWQKQR